MRTKDVIQRLLVARVAWLHGNTLRGCRNRPKPMSKAISTHGKQGYSYVAEGSTAVRYRLKSRHVLQRHASASTAVVHCAPLGTAHVRRVSPLFQSNRWGGLYSIEARDDRCFYP